MGKRGPKPTPTAILAQRGSWRAGEERRRNEVRPKSARPQCPRWLTKEARKIWRRIVPELLAMGVLTKIDGQALARYCTLYARWREAEVILAKSGPVIAVRNAQGVTISYTDRPEVARSARLAERLDRLEAKFGMTPADRVGMQAEVPTQAQGAGKARFFERAAKEAAG